MSWSFKNGFLNNKNLVPLSMSVSLTQGEQPTVKELKATGARCSHSFKKVVQRELERQEGQRNLLGWDKLIAAWEQ